MEKSKLKKAAFRLKNFKVTKFNFDFTEKELDFESIVVGFLPRGEFVKKDSTFNLYIKFHAFDEDSEENIFTAEIVGFFTFKEVEAFDDIPTFFYKNAIAILYPFLRAFVSNITLQANIGHTLILPTMNLSSLEAKLIDSTEEI